MTLPNDSRTRRRFLLAPLVGGLAAVLGATPRTARAQNKASLVAKAVAKVPEAVDDPDWQRSDVLNVPLAPQAVVKPRHYEAGVKSLSVRALYDADKVAFLLEWPDPRRDSGIGGVTDFRDAAALEFPGNPSNGIPYFAMGEPNKPVTIYQWKADWQFGREYDADERFPGMYADWYPFSGRPAGEIAEPTDYDGKKGDKAYHPSWWAGNPLGDPELQARTPVEKLRAEGFGSLTAVDLGGQDATGHGEWKDGVWRVRISIPRAQEGFSFERGMTVPLAFAVWDGTRLERGGEKAVSTWYFMSLEQPVGAALYWAPLMAAVGVAAAQMWGLRRLRHGLGKVETESGAGEGSAAQEP